MCIRDRKGKISASLLIRKMIERLSNEYETKVNSVQDTRCEIILKSDAAQDISEQLRGELAGMTGSMSCRILVELDDPEGALQLFLLQLYLQRTSQLR